MGIEVATLGLIGGLAGGLMGAGATIYGGVAANQAGKAEAKALKEAGRAAQQEADARAAAEGRQASLEETRAGIEQLSGEREAERRSRILAQDIGSMYANFAGNGLLVDGSSKDAVGAALRTQTAEGAYDIATINSNTAMNVWTRSANAASLRASAANARIYGRNQRAMYETRAKAARTGGETAMWQGLLSGTGQGLSALGGFMGGLDGGKSGRGGR